MTFRCLKSQPGAAIVYAVDDGGHLIQMWASTDPADFRIPAAQLVASLACLPNLGPK
jgi:hypothetical protein